MRQILIDFARARDSLKRGGEFKRMELDLVQDGLFQLDSLGDETGVLVETLDKLRDHDPDGFNVFWGRFVLGRTKQQVSDLLEIPLKEVDDHWHYAPSLAEERVEQIRKRASR